jgi:hypothetical protein
MIKEPPYFKNVKKLCYSCYKPKELYPVIKGKEKAICKECYTELYGDIFENEEKRKLKQRKLEKEIKKVNYEFVFNILKDSECSICKNKDFRVLEFDHRDRDLKENNISALISHGTLKKLKEEIGKCDILCANCHRIKTHKENNSWRNRFYEERQPQTVNGESI